MNSNAIPYMCAIGRIEITFLPGPPIGITLQAKSMLDHIAR